MEKEGGRLERVAPRSQRPQQQLPTTTSIWLKMQHDLIESPLILVDDPLYGHERNQRYKLVDRISDGGNIIAFVARYIDLDDAGKLVAIKASHTWNVSQLDAQPLPLPQFIKIQQADQPLSKFIEYELTSHRRLHHPHIIELKEVFLTEEYIAVVMEYAAGGDLFSLARELGKLTGIVSSLAQANDTSDRPHLLSLNRRQSTLFLSTAHLSPSLLPQDGGSGTRYQGWSSWI